VQRGPNDLGLFRSIRAQSNTCSELAGTGLRKTDSATTQREMLTGSPIRFTHTDRTTILNLSQHNRGGVECASDGKKRKEEGKHGRIRQQGGRWQIRKISGGR